VTTLPARRAGSGESMTDKRQRAASPPGGHASSEKEPAPGHVPKARVRAELQAILSSRAFAHSERLRRFLRFAVEQVIEGRGDRLKEYHIGLEVFDRPESYDPRIDPIVRVEASRLRTKLREYYSSEGRRADILIDLPKGSYVPVFRQRAAEDSWFGRLLRSGAYLKDPRNLAIAILGLCVVVLLVWVSSFRGTATAALEAPRSAVVESFDPRTTPIWGPFFSEGAKNYVIFGSPIFFASQKERLFLRWPELNKALDFQNDPMFQKMQSRFGPLSGPRYDYALTGDALAVQRLTSFFGRFGGELDALPAHRADWEEIRSANIIFVGAPRMIPLLDRLPVPQEFEWDADQNVVNRNPQPGEPEKFVTPSHWEELSYAIIGCFPGLKTDRRILLLTAHSAPGALAAVEYVTQSDSLRQLMSRLAVRDSAEPVYFQMVLRVVVDQGAPVKSEYLTHHVLSVPGS